jgi:hypothetical protein
MISRFTVPVSTDPPKMVMLANEARSYGADRRHPRSPAAARVLIGPRNDSVPQLFVEVS